MERGLKSGLLRHQGREARRAREREPSTPRITEPLQEWITAGNGTLGQKDSTAKKASDLVTTHGKEQRKRSEGWTKARRRGDEEKEKASEGCNKERPPTQRGCRAFSDVVERSETIGTEKKKKAPKIRLGVARGCCAGQHDYLPVFFLQEANVPIRNKHYRHSF